MPWGVMLAALIMRLYIAQDHDHDQNHHQGYGGVGHDLDQCDELAHLRGKNGSKLWYKGNFVFLQSLRWFIKI